MGSDSLHAVQLAPHCLLHWLVGRPGPQIIRPRITRPRRSDRRDGMVLLHPCPALFQGLAPLGAPQSNIVDLDPALDASGPVVQR